jgi:formylglycine-generating enzyme required for sulfatase activity
VGAKRPNELGLLDMSGNVWEWCQDGYQNTYTGLAATDPAGPGKGEFRVLRGGGWNGEESHCRSTCRGRMDPSYTTSFLGFRVALAPALAPAGQAK